MVIAFFFQKVDTTIAPTETAHWLSNIFYDYVSYLIFHAFFFTEMAVPIPMILTTLIVTPLLYLFYQLYLFLVNVKRLGKGVDQFPGEKKHWLFGHLHKVS